MQANLLKYYASSIMCDIISIIIALLLFICQSSLESATDMKQLMIFVTVIHLIISGDVESNPGPSFDARGKILTLLMMLVFFNSRPPEKGTNGF